LLSASIASTKTVIANPVLYLNNHIHDILYTIVQMKSPPHPNIEDVKVMKSFQEMLIDLFIKWGESMRKIKCGV